ncbi:ATP-binding protein [bacterium]|nr:ATP-binding protein [bacterium]
MDIKIDENLLTGEQKASLVQLDGELRQSIIELCSTERGREVQVEYGTALVKSADQQSYKLSHNASFQLSYSYVIADAIGTKLKCYFLKNTIPDATLVVNLTFSKRENSQQPKTKSDISGTSEKRSGKTIKDESVTFIPINPKYGFEQIVLPDSVHDDLMNAVKLIEFRDLIFEQWGYGEIEPNSKCIINMYGPAGTGKTMCAHAIAKHVGKKLLALNYSEIESKYLGEAAKNLAAAFDTANKTDSVLFFDEADSFLGKRVQNVVQSTDQALNSLRSQMLILLENFNGVVVFATNLVSNFDEAFMSRIQKHIRFNLPDVHQRAEIIRKQIPSRLPLSHSFSSEEYEKIAENGEGLSGREIKNAIFELYLRKANSSSEVIFSIEDFSEAISRKVEDYKQLEEEKNQIVKQRILRKMAEKVQERALEKDMNSENTNPNDGNNEHSEKSVLTSEE